MSEESHENDSLDFIKQYVHCCACGEPMAESPRINLVALHRIATWENPSWGNLLIPGCRGLASAVLCDECIVKERDVKEVVEWDMSAGEVTYHPVEDLARWTGSNKTMSGKEVTHDRDI